MPYKEVTGLKIRTVSFGDTIIPEDHNYLVEALKNIKDRVKKRTGEISAEIETFIEGLRKVSHGDYVYTTDVSDVKTAILDLINYVRSIGYENTYLDLAETYAKMIKEIRTGDIIEPLHHNYLVYALENLDKGTEVIPAIKLHEPEASEGGGYVQALSKIYLYKLENGDGGGYGKLTGQIYLFDPLGNNGGGYGKLTGQIYLFEPQYGNGGGYVNVE